MPISETRSLPFALYRIGEHVCMHKARVQVLDNNDAISDPFRNPEVTTINVAGPLGPAPPRFMITIQLRLSRYIKTGPMK